jgi:hypothetical protein
MQNSIPRRTVKRLFALALVLAATALAAARPAEARRCCSTCPLNEEDVCWNFCALSC